MQLYALMAQAVVSDTPELIRQTIGQQALQASTLSEAQALQRLTYLQGYPWPANFRATAVQAATGEFIVWDQQAHVALVEGVASSSALPGALPPVTIGQQRYMDGGVRSMLNADLAVGQAHVLAISCFSLAVTPANTAQDILNRGLMTELEFLRQNGSVVDVISPNAEFLQLTKQGTEMLNLTLMPEAWQIGKRQAKHEKGYLAAAWHAG
jgi:NTE family protein